MIVKFIPSFITLLNLACGFLVFLVEPIVAPWLILIGGVLDVFDGAAARLLNAQSEIGKQLDSLADLVTFGAAPAYLLHLHLGLPFGYICVLPVLTGAYRLARFNVEDSGNYYFNGLAIPGSALALLGLVVLLNAEINIHPYLIITWIVLISFLNISTLRMFSFKGITKDLSTKVFLGICAVTAIICIILAYPWTLLITMCTYVALSFAYHIITSRKFSD